MEKEKKAKREKTHAHSHGPAFTLSCFHVDERVLRAAVERKKAMTTMTIKSLKK